MITGLRLHNFKAHRDLQVGLVDGDHAPRPLTVLVGPNGAGKTSVLQAVHFATGLMLSDPNQRMGEFEPSGLTAKGMDSFAVDLDGRDDEMPWSCTCAWSSKDQWRLDWQLGEGRGERKFPNAAPPAPTRLQRLTSRLLRLDPRRIAMPSYSDEETPLMSQDGAMAASVLANLKLTNDTLFAAIEADLRHLVPTLERLKIRPKKVMKEFFPGPTKQWVNGHQLAADFAGAHDVESDGFSDGTLLLLAVLTILHVESTAVLLIDDIEHSLHPVAQMELMRTMRRLLEGKRGLQIIATTHSPFVLDELDSSEVMVFYPRKDGSISMRPLSEHPNAASAKGTLSTGQLWSLDPEEWVDTRSDP